MRRLVFLLCLVVIAIACAREQNEPQTQAEDHLQKPGLQSGSDVPALNAQGKGRRVEFPTAGGTASGYLSGPAKSSGKLPAIIVIQEWWGVDDWIKEQTDRFAGEGYMALAVDLYRGRIATSPDEAHELMRGLPEDRAMADLKGAFNYLASLPEVDPARIGAIGWCMGGGYAARLAATEPRLKAAAINYGHLLTDANAIKNINAALLGNFGGQDRGIPVSDVNTFEQTARSSGKTIDFKIYPEQGHAFMNPNNKQGFSSAATEDAWRRIFSFFRTQLQGSAGTTGTTV